MRDFDWRRVGACPQATIWATAPNDSRALQDPSKAGARAIGCYYNQDTFVLDVVMAPPAEGVHSYQLAVCVALPLSPPLPLPLQGLALPFPACTVAGMSWILTAGPGSRPWSSWTGSP